MHIGRKRSFGLTPLAELLWAQASRGEHTDVTFVVDGGTVVRAHRAVLAANIPAIRHSLKEDDVVVFARGFPARSVVADLKRVYLEGRTDHACRFGVLSNLFNSCGCDKVKTDVVLEVIAESNQTVVDDDDDNACDAMLGLLEGRKSPPKGAKVDDNLLQTCSRVVKLSALKRKKRHAPPRFDLPELFPQDESPPDPKPAATPFTTVEGNVIANPMVADGVWKGVKKRKANSKASSTAILAPLMTAKVSVEFGDKTGKCTWCNYLSQSDEDLQEHVRRLHVGIHLSKAAFQEACCPTSKLDDGCTSEDVEEQEIFLIEEPKDIEDPPQLRITYKCVGDTVDTPNLDTVEGFQICSKDTIPKGQMQAHTAAAAHMPECEICSRRLPPAQMQAHTATHFPNEWKKECIVCKLVFSNQKSFDKHNLAVHGTSIPLVAPIAASDILRSKKSRGGVKCHLCIGTENKAMRYGNQEELSAHHAKDHYERDYLCDICSQVTVHWSLYEKHLKDHIVGNACPFCDKPFRFKQGNKLACFPHMYLHMDPAYFRFECVYCGDRFYSHMKKQEHENQQHTGNKTQFVCESCGKGFTTSARRAVHKKTAHKKRT